MKVEFYRKWMAYRWRITAANGEIVGASTQRFTTRDSAIKNFEMVTSRSVRARQATVRSFSVWRVDDLTRSELFQRLQER